MGANSYRTSHYPYAEEILDFADQNGIVIIGICLFAKGSRKKKSILRQADCKGGPPPPLRTFFVKQNSRGAFDLGL